MRSHIAYGSPNKHDTAEAHGSPLGVDEVLLTKRNLGWPSEEPFYEPEEVIAFYRQAIERGAAQEKAWQETYAAYRAAYPELAAQWELFEEQSPEYKESVLPKSITARLTIEAASPMGWERYTGPSGDTFTLNHFGASAPGKVLFQQFGFTVENVVEKAKKLI